MRQRIGYDPDMRSSHVLISGASIAAEYFGLPRDRSVIMGSRIDV